MGYYSAIKDEILLSATTLMYLTGIRLSEIEKDKCCMILIYVWNTQNKTKPKNPELKVTEKRLGVTRGEG